MVLICILYIYIYILYHKLLLVYVEEKDYINHVQNKTMLLYRITLEYIWFEFQIKTVLDTYMPCFIVILKN